MRKTLTVFAGITVCLLFCASVSDWRPELFDMFTLNFGGKSIDASQIRINGHLAKLTKYKSEKEAGDIIGWYMTQAAEKGYEVKDSAQISAAAGMFLNAGEEIPAGDYDYVFYKKPDKAALICSANSPQGSKTVIADIAAGAFESAMKTGYKDRLKHHPLADLALSLEFLAAGKTACFGNFYTLEGETCTNVRRQYLEANEKAGWNGIYETQSANGYVMILKKDSMQYVLSIIQQGGMVWLTVMG